MADVSDALGAFGAPPEIKSDGKTWKIGYPTQRAKTALNNLIVSGAADEITSQQGVLNPHACKMLWNSFREAIGAQDYETWGAGWIAGLSSANGPLWFLLALIRECQPEATLEDAVALAQAKPEEVSLAISRVAPPFLERLCEDHPMVKNSKGDQKSAAKAALMDSILPRLMQGLSATPSAPTATP